MPQDINSAYLNGKTPPQTFPHQRKVVDFCRRYLNGCEIALNEIGTTWMLTNDPDEFTWLNRDTGVQTFDDSIERVM
eukprot:4584002-Ditylum_brightwellii.AAC.1